MESQTDLQTSLERGPAVVTYSIIAINLLIYALLALLSQSLEISLNVLINAGAQQTAYIETTGQYWRIFTAMFLHVSLLHVGVNMLSLFPTRLLPSIVSFIKLQQTRVISRTLRRGE